MPKQFTGQLNSNELFSSIFNMIISQQVFADNLSGGMFSNLVNRFKTDGTLYGDSKLFYATDVLKSVVWGNDAEATNLLAIDRPKDPSCQAITLDQFRQIRVTVDYYLSKRAWSTEGAFGEFTSVVLGWVRDTKKVYEITLFNSFVGTVESNVGQQQQEIQLSAIQGDESLDTEGKNRLSAQTIAESIANVLIDMQDVSRDYNDYGYLRSYNPSELLCIWNSKFVNKIRKIDLPTIFNNEGIMDKFEEQVLPARYFGKVNAEEGTTASANTTIRSLIEKDYNTVSMDNPTYKPKLHIFPGDLLPNATAYEANETYTEDGDIICKLVHRNSFKFMSAFEVGTSFFNPRSLTENHYLTWGYSKPEYLANYPVVTFHAD